jgi:uncharacterized membrane protein
MVILQTVLLILAVVGQLYMFRFQGSPEGMDERGRDIRYKTTSFMYGSFSLAFLLLIVLHLLSLITSDQFIMISLYVYISLSIVGGVYTYWKKRI